MNLVSLIKNANNSGLKFVSPQSTLHNFLIWWKINNSLNEIHDQWILLLMSHVVFFHSIYLGENIAHHKTCFQLVNFKIINHTKKKKN